MKSLILISAITFFISCKTNNSDKRQWIIKVDPCKNLKDTFSTISIFEKGDSALAAKDFYEVVNSFESKGNLKLTTDKNTGNKVVNWKDIYLPHYIDSCNHKLVTQNFILKNVTATFCFFKSTTPLKGTKNYFPRFELTQWNFANNADRDSAYEIMQWVYSHGGTEYEYRYNSTVVSDKRLYLIEPRAKIFEETGIQYAKYLKQYLEGKTNNSR